MRSINSFLVMVAIVSSRIDKMRWATDLPMKVDAKGPRQSRKKCVIHGAMRFCAKCPDVRTTICSNSCRSKDMKAACGHAAKRSAVRDSDSFGDGLAFEAVVVVTTASAVCTVV